MKIYLCPSKQTANKYAYGNTNEQEQCNRIAEAAHKALVRCGFEVKRAPAGQAIETSVKQSNEWGADLHVPIHTNAGGGRGCVVFVSSLTADRLKFAQPVYDEISKVTVADEKYGVRSAGFYEIKYSNAKCVYIEAEFHDNAKDAKWIIDHVVDLGEAICRGICKGAGVAYVAKEGENNKPMENNVNTPIRYRTIDDVPADYRPELQELIDLGFNGYGDERGLYVTEDMLRCMIVTMRVAKALIDSIPEVEIDKEELFEEFKKNLQFKFEVV